MERMKKILTSPINKKKSVVTSRYFGVPLEELSRREGSTIPQLVQKICIFIQNQGEYLCYQACSQRSLKARLH